MRALGWNCAQIVAKLPDVQKTVRTEGDTVFVELTIVLNDCTMADVLLGLGKWDARRTRGWRSK